MARPKRKRKKPVDENSDDYNLFLIRMVSDTRNNPGERLTPKFWKEVGL